MTDPPTGFISLLTARLVVKKKSPPCLAARPLLMAATSCRTAARCIDVSLISHRVFCFASQGGAGEWPVDDFGKDRSQLT